MSQDRPAGGDEERPAVEADREAAYEIGRLMAFSDGVFAIAITLLVLNVPVPDIPQAQATSRLPQALLGSGPRLTTFALSFFLVGFYWIRHHQLFRQLADASVWLLWLNLVSLFVVCLLPFSSGVVGRYPNTVAGAEVYAVNLAAIALSFTALFLYATGGRLMQLPPGTVIGPFGRSFLWPLAVVGLVMVLAPINLAASYITGATLMAGVTVYTTIPLAVRSAPLAGTAPGRLRFGSIGPAVTVHADPKLTQLFQARLLGREPVVTVSGNAVGIEYQGGHRLGWRRQSADIALNPSIPWRLEVRGDVANLTADLRGLSVEAVDVSGSAARLDLRLPRPSGAVPIRILGGAADVSIRRPDGVAIGAVVWDAATIHFDEQPAGPIGGQGSIQSPGYSDATDRYEVEIRGGVAELTIAADRREADLGTRRMATE